MTDPIDRHLVEDEREEVIDMDTNIMPAGNVRSLVRALPWLGSTCETFVAAPSIVDHRVASPMVCDYGTTQCATVSGDADNKFSTRLGPTASPPV